MECRSLGRAALAAIALAATLLAPSLAAQERPVADLAEVERFAEAQRDETQSGVPGIADLRALTEAIWQTYPDLFTFEQTRHAQCLQEAKDLLAARDVDSVLDLPEEESDRVLRIIEIDGLLTDQAQERESRGESAFVALVTMLAADVLEVESAAAELLEQYRNARDALFEGYADGLGRTAEALATRPCGEKGTEALVVRYQSDREAFALLVARRLSMAVEIMTGR